MKRRPLCAVAVSAAALVVACSSSNSSSSQASTGAERYAQVWCTNESTCTPDGFAIHYGDLATCESTVGQEIAAQLQLPGVTLTDAALEACATALASAGCNADVSTLPACQGNSGTLAVGAACLDDNQCADFCSFPDTGDTSASDVECGTCATFSAVGQPCLPACKPGLGCNPTTNTCAAAPTKGQPCTADGVPCDGSEFCKNQVCSDPIAAGGACTAADVCADALTTCDSGVCTRHPPNIAALGQPCGADPTGGTVYCKASSCAGPGGGQTCVAFATVGEPCSLSGDAAATKPECGPALSCVNGTCAKVDASLCK